MVPRSWLLLVTGLLIGADLRQYLQIPFAEHLIRSEAGDQVAWIVNEGGARNVWHARAPQWQGRRVTSYTDDDGQEMGQLAFSPDGANLFFTRGGDLSTNRDIPNPTTETMTPEQAIFVADTKSFTVVKAIEGRDPLPLNGSKLLFQKDGKVLQVNLPGGKPQPLFQTKGKIGDWTLSHRGDQLAFVVTRPNNSYIGIYSFDSKSFRFIDASVDGDRYPVWSPDDKQLAYVRIATRSASWMFGPVREVPEPWTIRVADVATGKAKEVWRAQAGAGSAFSAIVADQQLFWSGANTILFPWEKTGWRLLYSVSLSGGPAQLLTPGELEVEHVSAARDGSSVLYSSNQGDINSRHAWLVGPNRPVQALTSGKGLEWSPVDTVGGTIVLRSDWKTPGHAALVEPRGFKELAPNLVPKDFPVDELVEPKNVVFPSPDGLPIHAQLFLPRKMQLQNKALVFLHGGSRRQMLPGFHYMYYYSNTYAANQYFASKGYIVLAVNYRSGIGYGLNFREALHYGATGASEVQDVLAAGQYLKTRTDVDKTKIAAWGGSYGGYLTAMALAKDSGTFAAGVDIHGVHDWNVVRRNFNPNWDTEKNAELARVARESSPISWLKGWKSPVLVIHGDDDRNVPFSETVSIVEALRKQKVDLEQLIFPDEVHDFQMNRHWIEALQASDDFLDRKLQKNPGTFPPSGQSLKR